MMQLAYRIAGSGSGCLDVNEGDYDLGFQELPDSPEQNWQIVPPEFFIKN